MDTTRPSQNSPTPKSGVATPRTPSIELWSELNVVERRIARHIHSTVDGHFYRMYPGQLPPTIRHFYLNIFLRRYFLRTFHTWHNFPDIPPRILSLQLRLHKTHLRRHRLNLSCKRVCVCV